MTTTELIISFGSTGIGSLLIGWWLNKKREDIEINLKEQIFYKELIKDLEGQRAKEEKNYTLQLDKLSGEIKILKEKIRRLIKSVKEKNDIIDKWEKYCNQLRENLLFEKSKNENNEIK